MGKTQHYGLNKFGAEGRLSDEGYKFTLRDRDLIDVLFHTLNNHDHGPVETNMALEGPPPSVYLDLTLATTGGVLPAGRDYYYKFSYLDTNGNETGASSAVLISTPNPLPAPESQVLEVATIGGGLDPGTWKYAMAFYQTGAAGGGTTTAPNLSTAVVPTGTSTNVVTIPLQELPDGAAGWKIYRKGPGDLEYWLLDTVAGPATEYVDDGTISPDCTKKRPLANTTNSTNKVTVALPASELPLDTSVGSWRIYRSSTPSTYPVNSLVAEVVDTTTEGGSDLVTTYDDVGDGLGTGSPLIQTAVPVPPGPLDASVAFGPDSGRLPPELTPRGVQAFNLLLPGVLTAKDYHQFSPLYDMLPRRINAFYATAAPTGLTPSTDFLTLRVEDDKSENEVQSLWNDSFATNEIQTIYTTASDGTFTLTFSGQTTASIPWDGPSSAIKTALEALTNITEVTVTGGGKSNDRWVVEFLDPGNQNVAQMTATTSFPSGGSVFIQTVTAGNDGGTFTLSDGTDATSAIAYNADAATIETRLETDIISIIDVTVTGSGTEADPWIITYLDPGGQNVEPLIPDDALLSGGSHTSQVTRGYGPTQIDLVIDLNQQAFSWQAPTTEFGIQQAEEAPATGGVEVSDNLATNDLAMILDAQFEFNEWGVGALDPGDYVFRFWVSNFHKTAVFQMTVADLNGPTTLATVNVDSNRSVYTPAYEIELTLDGTEDIRLRVEKTDTGTDQVRVDKYEYELHPRILHADSAVVLSVLETGVPTTNGEDLQVSLWY